MASPRRPFKKSHQSTMPQPQPQLEAIRLEKLDAEIRRIYDVCLECGYDHRQIQEVSLPVLKLFDGILNINSKDDKYWPKSISMSISKLVAPKTWMKIIVVLLVLCGVVNIDWSPIVLSTYGRNALISVLPYWDWSQLYYQDCLVRNPYHVHRKLTSHDCQICEALDDKLPRIENVSHSEITEDYLKSDVPAIIVDALQDWDLNRDTFSLKNISKILLDADPKGDALPCAFASNLRLRGDNYYRTFLWKLNTENMESKRWYAHWENCDKTLAKALRRHHNRPYFIPPMVDTTEPNWLFTSGSQFKGRHFKQVSILSDMLWMAQLQGSVRIQLRPRHPCNETATCITIDDVLTKGETLMFTDRMWTLHYLPTTGSVNVAIGSGCSFEL